ncbi:hypothetical protein CHRYSEOSP005_28660 [Chryseobacterium sp. Alg-005]
MFVKVKINDVKWHKDCNSLRREILNFFIMERVKKTFSHILSYIKKTIFVKDVI